MTAGISPRRLLAQAESLAGIGSSPGRPSSTDLRRAASKGYYALFHALTRDIAWSVLGEPQGDELWLPLTRSVTHKAIEDVSRWLTGAKPPEHLGSLIDNATQDRDLVLAADVFINALDTRHRADYDHLAFFNKAEVVGVLAAIQAVLLRRSELRRRSTFRIFGVAVLLKSTPR